MLACRGWRGSWCEGVATVHRVGHTKVLPHRQLQRVTAPRCANDSFPTDKPPPPAPTSFVSRLRGALGRRLKLRAQRREARLRPEAIGSSDKVELFPGWMYLLPNTPDQWRVVVQGWVHRVRERDTQRVQSMQRRFAIPQQAALTWYWLLLKNCRNTLVSALRIADPRVEPLTHDASPIVTARTGLFTFATTVRVAPGTLSPRPLEPPPRLPVLLQDGDRQFQGHVLALCQRGVSVITDIDDTIKLTEVRRKRRMLRNVLLRRFEPVDGMGDLFRGWQQRGVTGFHYVSTSPFQLLPQLQEFIERCGFPQGTIHLNAVGWKSPHFWLQDKKANLKPQQIEELLRAFPERSFVLVGDSAQKDPRVYCDIATRFPHQVRRIFIRKVVGGKRHERRLQRLLASVPPSTRCTVFTEVDQGRMVEDVAALVCDVVDAQAVREVSLG